MKIGVAEKTQLAILIKDNIEKEFKIRFVTHNLVKTIRFGLDPSGNVTITIPAPKYDISLWKEKKVVAYTGKGSYAHEVDRTGGFSLSHTNYVERCIRKAVDEWLRENNFKGKVVKR